MPLDATVGGANANSFVTLAAANTYFETRTHATSWTGTNEAKEKALITATQRLNQETFAGVKASTTQALKWPRYDTADADGYPYASDAIPQALKDATCELALELMATAALAQSKLTNYARLKIGPLDITPQQPQKSGALPAQVLRLLSGLLMSAPSTIRMVRG